MHADSETDACRDDQRTGHVFPVRTADAQQQLCHLDTSNITLVLQGTGTHIPSWDFPGKKRGRGVKEPDLAHFQIKMWSRRASSVGIWQDFWHIPSASLVWLHFSVCSFTHWLKVSFFHPKFLFWNYYRKNTFCPGASGNTSLIAPCVLLGQLFIICLPWNTSKKILRDKCSFWYTHDDVPPFASQPHFTSNHLCRSRISSVCSAVTSFFFYSSAQGGCRSRSGQGMKLYCPPTAYCHVKQSVFIRANPRHNLLSLTSDPLPLSHKVWVLGFQTSEFFNFEKVIFKFYLCIDICYDDLAIFSMNSSMIEVWVNNSNSIIFYHSCNLIKIDIKLMKSNYPAIRSYWLLLFLLLDLI